MNLQTQRISEKRNVLTGTRRKASSISSLVRPFFSRNDILYLTGDPLTFGCDRNFIAFCTWSSRIGSEFTKTEGGDSSVGGSVLASLRLLEVGNVACEAAIQNKD